MQTSAARIAERRLHPRERRAGCPPRTSGDGAWAAPNPRHNFALNRSHVQLRGAERFPIERVSNADTIELVVEWHPGRARQRSGRAGHS